MITIFWFVGNMFVLRRLRVHNSTALFLRRSNVSLQSLDSTPLELAPSPPAIPSAAAQPISSSPARFTKQTPSTTQGRRRRRREPIPTQRPNISAANPRKWNRPLAEGVLPAYDLALKVIRTDSIQLCNDATELEAHITKKEVKVQALRGPMVESAHEHEEALEKMREKLYILQVQSQINLPDVRWRVANAMGAFFLLAFSNRSVADLRG
jgi:hypothetical protein